MYENLDVLKNHNCKLHQFLFEYGEDNSRMGPTSMFRFEIR
jgi:hypothetical protein